MHIVVDGQDVSSQGVSSQEDGLTALRRALDEFVTASGPVPGTAAPDAEAPCDEGPAQVLARVHGRAVAVRARAELLAEPFLSTPAVATALWGLGAAVEAAAPALAAAGPAPAGGASYDGLPARLRGLFTRAWAALLHWMTTRLGLQSWSVTGGVDAGSTGLDGSLELTLSFGV